MKKNLEFLSKALSLLPEVKETLVPPKEGQFFSKPLGKGDSVTIDFGKHLVGHLQVKMGYVIHIQMLRFGLDFPLQIGRAHV